MSLAPSGISPNAASLPLLAYQPTTEFVLPSPRIIDFGRPEQASRWDEFVRAHPRGYATDLSGWRLLYRELFGLRAASFAVMDGGAIVGVASAYFIASPFFGRLLVTSPYFGYGGLVADDPAVRAALIRAMQQTGIARRAHFIEWRLSAPLAPPYRQHNHFREFRLALDADADTIFKNTLRSNVRQNIRKARRHPLEFRLSRDPNHAWKLVSRTIRDLGTPYHSRHFFELLLKYFPDDVSFSEVHHQGRVVAAGVLLQFQNTLLTPYIGSLANMRHTNANYKQYWGIIQHCIHRGITRFELGRSPKGSTHEHFKLKWGAEPIDVAYSVKTISGRRRYRTVTEASALERRATRVWAKLPLSLTRTLGHYLYRYLP